MARMWPKAEALVVARLAAATGVPTSAKVPNPRPASYFVVQLTGSTLRSTGVRDCQVTIAATAPTESAASDLADAAVEALTGWSTDHAWIPEGEDGWAGGPYSFPDPVADLPRYQMTVIVRCIEESA